ncbi:MAG: hypothetical protein UZ17_ACD001001705 [Acidobacteria bacterium OLB17]|nr:MAG: hypothetical protein UZ17_ACD001001705 [Acidobacteria bacterium OLB17]MCZ2390705.1 hypothetical protein [Acidobacteriota bacterium]
MRFDEGIQEKYRDSVTAAFDTIMRVGDDEHRMYIGEILASEMLIRVAPVSEVKASGITGVISSVKTNYDLATERLSLRDALGLIYIAIAEETIDTGGQRGCEGTLVHEGRHAYDFAQMIESRSNADMNPLDVLDPTLYDLEWNAHKAAGNYMLRVGKQEYLDEGLGLMILCGNEDGTCAVDDDGIRRRLKESYGLEIDANQGPLASKMIGILV